MYEIGDDLPKITACKYLGYEQYEYLITSIPTKQLNPDQTAEKNVWIMENKYITIMICMTLDDLYSLTRT